jgi:hypothetical protein
MLGMGGLGGGFRRERWWVSTVFWWIGVGLEMKEVVWEVVWSFYWGGLVGSSNLN